MLFYNILQCKHLVKLLNIKTKSVISYLILQLNLNKLNSKEEQIIINSNKIINLLPTTFHTIYPFLIALLLIVPNCV